jgi:hypothetical protein
LVKTNLRGPREHNVYFSLQSMPIFVAFSED